MEVEEYERLYTLASIKAALMYGEHWQFALMKLNPPMLKEFRAWTKKKIELRDAKPNYEPLSKHYFKSKIDINE